MTEDGLLLPGCTSKEKFGSGKLHVEFRCPSCPKRATRPAATAASMCKDATKSKCSIRSARKRPDNGCGAIYSLKAPDQNMCYPPGVWQTYDINFTAAEYKDGQKVKDPIITVKQNDVVVTRKTSLPQATPGGKCRWTRARPAPFAGPR